MTGDRSSDWFVFGCELNSPKYMVAETGEKYYLRNCLRSCLKIKVKFGAAILQLKFI